MWLEGRRIAIVEDDPLMGESLVQSLSPLGGEIVPDVGIGRGAVGDSLCHRLDRLTVVPGEEGAAEEAVRIAPAGTQHGARDDVAGPRVRIGEGAAPPGEVVQPQGRIVVVDDRTGAWVGLPR